LILLEHYIGLDAGGYLTCFFLTQTPAPRKKFLRVTMSFVMKMGQYAPYWTDRLNGSSLEIFLVLSWERVS